MTSKSEIVYLSVAAEHHQLRLDKAIVELYPELSRSRIKGLIEADFVQINDKPINSPSYKVSDGENIAIMIPEPIDDRPKPENIPLEIFYEDQDLLVINKPVGMVVHPGAGNFEGTLVNALLYHCKDNLSGIGGVKRPGIVHRLDKDTSGLIVVAKNDKAHQGLSDQLQDRTLYRTYTAFVWKTPTLIKGKINQPIGRHPTNRLKMAIRKSSGREAITHYQVKENYGGIVSCIECKLESGRTHQIRVHMQHMRHPLLGDPLYGLAEQERLRLLQKGNLEEKITNKINNLPRQALHALEIGFVHPVSEEKMGFSCPLPKDLRDLENHLKTIS